MRANRHRLNGGLISQELAYSADLEKYHNASLNADNVIVSSKGDISKRNGTRILDTVLDVGTKGGDQVSKENRIIPFSVGNDENFIIYFSRFVTNTYVVIYKVLDDDSGLETLLEPQQFSDDSFGGLIIGSESGGVADLQSLQYAQSFNALYIANETLKPTRIVRYTDGKWGIEDVSFIGGPFQKQNTDKHVLVNVAVPEFEIGVTYEQGDVVGNNPVTEVITDAYVTTNVFWRYEGYTTRYLTTIEVVGTAMSVDTEFIISGTEYLDGKYTVQDIIGNVVYFDRGAVKYFDGITEYNTETETINAGAYGPAEVLHNKTGDIDNQLQTYTCLEDYDPLFPSADEAELDDATLWRKNEFATGELTLKSNTDLFTADDVGGKFKITQVRDSSVKRGTFSASNTTSESYPVTGEVILKTGGRWDGVIVLEESTDGGSEWAIIGSVASNKADTNKEIARTVDSGTLVRVRMQNYSATDYTDPSGCQWSLILNATFDSYFDILDYIGPREVQVLTENNVSSNLLTYRWAHGSFSKRFGYPSAVAFHDERLMYGGTNTERFTFWGSEIDNFENFVSETLATSPITFKILSESICNIRWFSSNRGNLIIGTDSSEWILSPRTNDELISGSNFKLEKQSDYGCSDLQPVRSNNTMFYVQRSGKAIRTFQYNYDADGYVSPDQTLIAPQVAENGIRAMSFQRTPNNTLWAVDGVGECYTYGFNQEQKIMAWTRQEFGGYEDNEVIAGDFRNTGGYIVNAITLPSSTGDKVYTLARKHKRIGDNIYSEGVLTIEEVTEDEYIDMSLTKDSLATGGAFMKVNYDGSIHIAGSNFFPQFVDKSRFVIPSEQVYENYVVDLAGDIDFGGPVYDQTYQWIPLLEHDTPTPVPLEVTNGSIDLDGTVIRNDSGVVLDKNGDPIPVDGYRMLIEGIPYEDFLTEDKFYMQYNPVVNLSRYVINPITDTSPSKVHLQVFGDTVPMDYVANEEAPYYVEPEAGQWSIDGDELKFGAGSFDKLSVGLPYKMKFTPTPLPLDNQNLQIHVTLKAIYLYMIESGGGRIGSHYMWDEPERWEDIDVRTEEDIENNIAGNFTGRNLVQLTSQWYQDMVFTIESEEQAPFKLASVGYEFAR